jgi:lipopolysaccharide/colanic/teichoic acid biosynthesis glycosyltransferase
VSATLRNGIVKYCVEKNKACYFVPHTGDVIISGAEHIRSFSVPICRARRSRPAPEYLLLKRAMDIVLSLLAIIVLSPFMALAALAIWSYDRGPVLYKQVRLTQDGRTFEILKLRSMIVDAREGRRPPSRRARRQDYAGRSNYPCDSTSMSCRSCSTSLRGI